MRIPIIARYTAPTVFTAANAIAERASTIDSPDAHSTVCINIPVEMPSADTAPGFLPPAIERLITYTVSVPGVRFSITAHATNAP